MNTFIKNHSDIEVEDRVYSISELFTQNISQNRNNHVNTVFLNEASNKELKNWVDPKVAYRAKTQKLKIRYNGVNKQGVIHFKCSSGTTKGKWYSIRIMFKDLDVGLSLLQENPKYSHRSIVSLVQTGELAMHCTDPSWKYWGWQYIGTQKGYAIKPENRFPYIRNPHLTGSVCKHLYAVLTALPFYTSEIVRDYRKRGVFPALKGARNINKKSVKITNKLFRHI